MTVVYLDTLLLVNFMANYLALRAAASLAGLPIRRGLLALSALLGAVYAGAVFLPGMTWRARWPGKAAAGAVMVVVAFGGCGRLLRAGVTFFLTAAALGGLVLAAELLGGRQLVLENGVLYAHVDLRLLLLLLLGSYLVLEMALRRVWSGRDRHCGEAEVRLPGGTARLRVLLDTGNTLTDPLTNRPVLVAEGAALPPEEAALSIIVPAPGDGLWDAAKKLNCPPEAVSAALRPERTAEPASIRGPRL